MPAGGSAEAIVTGLAPYLSLALQGRQLGQQAAYQQGQLGLQSQQIGQAGAYQRGELANVQQQLQQTGAFQKAQIRNQALEALTRAGQADPLGILGIKDQVAAQVMPILQGQQGAAGGQVPQAFGAQPPGGMGVMAGASPLSTALKAGVSGDQLLAAMPIPLANQIRGILQGNIAPGSLSARNPTTQQLMMLAQQVDPNFDATQYGARFSVAKDFSSGQSSQAIKSVNQTMSHAAKLLQNIEQLNNYGGLFPGAVNYIANLAGEHALGQATQKNFEQTAMALSSELRKVFAASGGGSLSELRSWEDTLPVNGSPYQQREALQNGMELLHGALSALQDKYQRGMGPNADVTKLLSPKARAALDYISSMDPRTGRVRGLEQPVPQGQGGGIGQPMFAVNPQTRERIVSQDGGQTWQPAR